MKNTIGTIIIGIAILTGVVLGYLQSEKFLKNIAVQGCLTAGMDNYVNENGLGGANIPNYESYKICMKEKGYSTSLVK